LYLFSNDLDYNTQYYIYVEGVTDLAGNILSNPFTDENKEAHEFTTLNHAPVFDDFVYLVNGEIILGGEDLTIDELDSLQIQLVANDVDNDGLSYTVNGLDLGGDVFVFDTGFNDAGSYDFSFVVSDGELEDVYDLTVNVNNVNRNPVFNDFVSSHEIVNGVVEIDEGEEFSLVLDANDVDNDDLVYNYESLDLVFADVLMQDNVFVYGSQYDQSGVYSVDFFVTDVYGGRDVFTLILNVNDVNRAPEFLVDNFVYSINHEVFDGENILLNEGEEFSLVLDASDADNDDLVYSVNGEVLVGDVYMFRPGFDGAGVYNLEFVVSDGVLEDSFSLEINVGDFNRAPEFDDFVFSHDVVNDVVEINEGEEFRVILNAHDLDNDDLVYSVNGEVLVGDVYMFRPGFDGDGDGYVDCYDYDCVGNIYCTEYDCDNLIDDDNDGYTDCDDIDCIIDDFCYSLGGGDSYSEIYCSDGLDGDMDGFVDCDDIDCITSFECSLFSSSEPIEEPTELLEFEKEAEVREKLENIEEKTEKILSNLRKYRKGICKSGDVVNCNKYGKSVLEFVFILNNVQDLKNSIVIDFGKVKKLKSDYEYLLDKLKKQLN